MLGGKKKISQVLVIRLSGYSKNVYEVMQWRLSQS